MEDLTFDTTLVKVISTFEREEYDLFYRWRQRDASPNKEMILNFPGNTRVKSLRKCSAKSVTKTFSKILPWIIKRYHSYPPRTNFPYRHS